ncbi:MAG: DUF2070 family protein [Candidatus Nanohaloarchaea archaeon]
MGSDNVDIFKKIVFSLPSTRTDLAAMFVLGTFYAGLMFLGIETFTAFRPPVEAVIYIAVFLFILPTLLSAEAMHRTLPDYPRKWGYFLSLVNQLIIFLYSMVLTGADNTLNAWNIIWLGLMTVFLGSFFVLIVSKGLELVKRIAAVSLVHPAMIIIAFHLFLGSRIGIPPRLYLMNTAVLLVLGAILIAIFFIAEYLMGSNVAISAFELTSGILQEDQRSLDLGRPVRPDVQTLKLENDQGELTVAVPWVHPGPLDAFGGGKLTQKVIGELNREGDGFFLHVPCSHREDLANPGEADKVLEALQDPECADQASRMVKKEYELATLYGRRIGDQKIIYMDAPGYDDYHVAIFREFIDRDDTMLIDLHNHDDQEGPDRVMFYSTTEADEIRREVEDMIEVLEDEELHDYSAGYGVRMGEKPVFALAEEVQGQETLLFGVEGNGSIEETRRLRDEMAQEVDEAILFSTDTHASLHELAKGQEVDIGLMREAIQEARESISPARTGFSNTRAREIHLLREDYLKLIFSINMLIRGLILALIVYYIVLVLWVF